jgi:hypothetical protein
LAKQPPKSRELLRQALSDVLIDINLAGPSASGQRLEGIFNDAIESLDDLDYGELPEVFTPSKTKRRDSKPAQVRQLQLLAIVHVEALRRRGLSAKAAHDAVAKEYFVDAGTIKSWRTKAKSESTDEYKHALRMAASLDRTRLEMFEKKLSSVEYLLQSTRKNGRAHDDLKRGKAIKRISAQLLFTRG